ncbi:MscS family membrane protein [Pontibacter ummariensis]|uniref:MscS family membrane protein n=1 Tax=Pontibacter ummariensis TaxID=1610492 RepID=A0A239GU26_9BACT|nr:mechanosensitive ion channel family protein [Pontibacter ummariensis]PRY11021.1 MscS family membrane protein [Pontibacter ummariensis]SNS72726.1 MscS family membrane protein [Pontibacter ummariensis]
MKYLDWKDILEYSFLGNTVGEYLISAGILLFGFIFKTLLSRLLSTVLYKLVHRFLQEADLPEFRRLLIQPLEVLLFLVFLYLAFQVLDYPLEISEIREEDPFLKTFFFRTYQVFVIVALTWVFLRFVDFFALILRYRAEKTPSKLDDQLVPFFKDFSKVVLVIFSFLIMLGVVFGVNVGGLVAGLGVGGLAIAFAAKESLENLLASFTIFLDQPFVVGDLVQVGDLVGVIEKIGFRSTRIRTLEKSFVTVPNKNMIDKPLDNLSLRTFRRAKFDINLTYNTTSEQIRAITNDIQEFIDHHPRTSQEGRIRFLNLGPHSKDVMVLYFVDTMDWNEYIDIKEEINYKIVDIVAQHGAEFAFPTQTLYMHPAAPAPKPSTPRMQTFGNSTDLK